MSKTYDAATDTYTFHFETKLHPYKSGNEREIEMMVGKAMCAYANYYENKKNEAELVFKFGIRAFEQTQTALNSELEATERCIAMFVKDSMYTIGTYVIKRATEEFDLC